MAFKYGVECEGLLKDLPYSFWNKFIGSDMFVSRMHLMRIIEAGKIIKKYFENFLDPHSCGKAFETTLLGHSCLALNTDRKGSQIFGNKIHDYDLVCIFSYNGTKYSYSIYSAKDNVNCSKIAENFGGGGHKGASGFSSDKIVFGE